jgi:hypothetical protein
MTGNRELVGQLKFHAQRAVQRGDRETAERYLKVLGTLLPPDELLALRSDLKLTRSRRQR